MESPVCDQSATMKLSSAPLLSFAAPLTKNNNAKVHRQRQTNKRIWIKKKKKKKKREAKRGHFLSSEKPLASNNNAHCQLSANKLCVGASSQTPDSPAERNCRPKSEVARSLPNANWQKHATNQKWSQLGPNPR